VPIRVAGMDPGTSSLDVLALEDGRVSAQHRFSPQQLQADPTLPLSWLQLHGPFELIAGPSGYGLPLVPAQQCRESDLALMALVRPDERGQARGVLGFSSLLRTLTQSSLPILFLPGVIHLPTVPAYRKINRIDLGTVDKLCVAALALAQRSSERGQPFDAYHGCVVELGLAFTACLVLREGRLVDGLGGSCGPPGWSSAGAWDGELAYLLSPLEKKDLFIGGVRSVADAGQGKLWFREELFKAVAGLRAVTCFDEIVLSGRLLESEPEEIAKVEEHLRGVAPVVRLSSLPEVWVKHAAQGAALLADGLAGGAWSPLVEHLQLRQARGSVLDFLEHPRAAEIRRWFEG
jgi:predicted butyrate kinase (DUF1464 family)